MKKRLKFVSNSSSSTFIIRKSGLPSTAFKAISDFFEKYDGHGNTDFDQKSIDTLFLKGELESHWGPEDSGTTYRELFEDILEKYDIDSVDYEIRYGEDVGEENLT